MDLQADTQVLGDILPPSMQSFPDTDLDALFPSSSGDTMLCVEDTGMGLMDDSPFMSWNESFAAAPQAWQWQEMSIKQEPVHTEVKEEPTSSPGTQFDSHRPSFETLEATVMSQTSKGRESGLKHLAIPEDEIPDSLDKLSDQQLAMVDFKVLMALMTKAGLSKEEISEVKARRRRLKNRLSARLCSNKKREKCSELEETNRDLLTTLRELTQENQQLKEENSKLQEESASMSKASMDSARENAMLRAQVAQLTQLLANVGIVPDEGAAFAA